VMRLQSIRIFNGADGPHRCPVCSSDLPVEVPTVSALTESLRRCRGLAGPAAARSQDTRRTA
jgi:hypothetical protein